VYFVRSMPRCGSLTGLKPGPAVRRRDRPKRSSKSTRSRGRAARQTTVHSTGTPRGVAQLKQLAGQQDRLREVHDKRSLSIRSQSQPPHLLPLVVSRLLCGLLCHRPKHYRAHHRRTSSGRPHISGTVSCHPAKTERGGFEPPNEVNPRYAISSRAHSTALAPLHRLRCTAAPQGYDKPGSGVATTRTPPRATRRALRRSYHVHACHGPRQPRAPRWYAPPGATGRLPPAALASAREPPTRPGDQRCYCSPT
jgi:hypothetical protein